MSRSGLAGKTRFVAASLLTALVLASTSIHSAGDDISRFEYRDFQKGEREFDAGDYEDAYTYWKSLADEGVPEAQYNIGRMYAYGEGVPKNYEVAYAWFLRAQENGADEATDALRQLLRYVSRDEISAAEARARDIARREAGLADSTLQPRLHGTGDIENDNAAGLDTGE